MAIPCASKALSLRHAPNDRICVATFPRKGDGQFHNVEEFVDGVEAAARIIERNYQRPEVGAVWTNLQRLQKGAVRCHPSTIEAYTNLLIDIDRPAGSRPRFGASAPCFSQPFHRNRRSDGGHAFHRSHGRGVTATAVQPPARFGGLGIDGTTISAFQEKPKGEGGWINGGFFVLSPAVFKDDSSMFEGEPMQNLTLKQQVQAHFIAAFGNRLTPCETNNGWKNSGPAGERLGKRGKSEVVSGILSNA